MQAPWPSEYVILGLLAEQPMHGYELAQRLSSDEALCAIWHIERSQVYFLLGKLIERGHIAETGEQQASGPTRVIYAPTAEGRAALLAWLRVPEPSPRGLRAAFLAKLYFALRSYPEIAHELLAGQKSVLAEWAGRHRAGASGHDFAALVHRLRMVQVEAVLAILEEVDPDAEMESPEAETAD